MAYHDHPPAVAKKIKAELERKRKAKAEKDFIRENRRRGTSAPRGGGY